MVDRIEKARQLAKLGLIAILKKDKQGRPTLLKVPGTEGKSYQIVIRRNKGTSVECNLDMAGLGLTPCQGNQKVVCYHAISALIYSAFSQGKEIAIAESHDSVERLSHIYNGTVHRVDSWNGGRPIYICVWDK